MAKKPLVSIIMSTYNWEKYISESIESVLKQSYNNFEFIIINDSSNDNTEKIILKYKIKDSRIIYIKNKKNLKLTKSLNKWLNIAKWKYIARIDDDDIWLKEKLLKQVIFMDNNPEYWICGTSTIIINSLGEERKKVLMRETNHQIKNNILKSNQFTHSSILIRKYTLDKVWWLYNNSYNWAEDYELWLRIWVISKVYNLPDNLVKYRWLESSIGRTKSLQQKVLWIKILLLYKNHYPHYTLAIITRILTLLIPEKIKKILLNI